MIKTICENILIIFGTICAVSVASLITYSIFVAICDEFGFDLPWRKND